MIGAVTIWEIIWTGGVTPPTQVPSPTCAPNPPPPPQPSCKQADQNRLLRSTSRKSTLNLTQETKERAISRKELDSETDRSKVTDTEIRHRP